ncbi:efflux RND transporter periplasmic adaptor subunit [Massilia litorea]|uniref:HlyD family efflux transporter periplasmic adaptor subunit n=1 Tax=Massilia litorea TaxID=2769491 RepID=A0A7L9U014_9BURK|nr:HlyD family efflux transporter periplasmic adaptor subunit [Massilia litorea]QOL48217.1 HlyD family efflux transporter periplasmic adaptor subunit [Massilia litorea]
MDTIVPRKRGKAILLCALAAVLLLAGGAWLWHQVPRGLRVERAELAIASVQQGVFRDELVVRANAAPLDSVILDSVESGRIEEVFVRDGELVKKGQLLFRIANPQRNLELLARQAEQAQQLYNLANLRLAQESDRSARQRRLDELAFNLEQARKRHARNERLAAQGFISAVALEESRDAFDKEARAIGLEQRSAAADSRVRTPALTQLEKAIGGLDTGLQLVQATVDALVVRAPGAGRLTDFRMQVGESIATGRNVGRIDDPSRFKLAARIDEFYLNRVAVGRTGAVDYEGRRYPVRISGVYPQIKEGRFLAELLFADAQPPALRPGQSLDAQLTLGDPARALLLPGGAWTGDSGGAWVYVVDASGRTARRREVRTGRRSNAQVEVLAGLEAGERVIVSSYAAFGQSTALSISK